MTRELYVIFTGRVQGVGFRATVCSLAQNLNLCGVVRNLPDGTVELIAQGEDEKVERLLVELKSRFPASMYAKKEWRTGSIHYDEFNITR